MTSERICPVCLCEFTTDDGRITMCSDLCRMRRQSEQSAASAARRKLGIYVQPREHKNSDVSYLAYLSEWEERSKRINAKYGVPAGEHRW